MKSQGQKLNRAKRRNKIRKYLTTQEYNTIKFSVVSHRTDASNMTLRENIMSHKLREKIRLYAYSCRVKEKPMMLPVVQLKIRRYIKEIATDYIPRLL